MNLFKYYNKPQQLDMYKRGSVHKVVIDDHFANGTEMSNLQLKEISKDGELSLKYAKDVIEGRFKLGEKAIAKNGLAAMEYARVIINKSNWRNEKQERWPEGEKAIAKDPIAAAAYSREIIKGAWPEGEKAIAQDAFNAFWYAKEILDARFPQGEKAISNDSLARRAYNKFLKKKGEDVQIEKGGDPVKFPWDD